MFPIILHSISVTVTCSFCFILFLHESLLRYSINDVQDQKTVVWIGTPGIGKSSVTNYMLLHYLPHMGDADWPREILLRVSDMLVVFRMETAWNGSRRVNVEVRECADLNELNKHCKTFMRFKYNSVSERPLLLLDLKEKESDPDAIFVNLFSSQSSRDANNAFKTYDKGGGLSWILAQPWSRTQVLDSTRLWYRLNEGGLPFLSGGALSEAAAVYMMDGRFEYCGGRLRFLIKHPEAYAKYCDGIKSFSLTPFEDIRKTSVFNLPSDVKFFLSFFLRDGVTNPAYCVNIIVDGKEVSNFEYRPLSPRLGRLLVQHIKNEDMYRSLNEYVPYHVLAECIVNDYYLRDANSRTPDKFKVYSDPGERYLSEACLVPHAVPVYSERIIYRSDGDVVGSAIDNLRDKVLYIPESPRAKLFDSFGVDKKNKLLHLFQTTTSDLLSHSFKVSVLEKALSGFGVLNSGLHDDYNVMLYCFIGMGIASKGCHFIMHSNAVCEDETRVTLEGWKSQQKKMKKSAKMFNPNRLSTIIVKTKFKFWIDSDEHVNLSSP
jgi:hypothetical protein